MTGGGVGKRIKRTYEWGYESHSSCTRIASKRIPIETRRDFYTRMFVRGFASTPQIVDIYTLRRQDDFWSIAVHIQSPKKTLGQNIKQYSNVDAFKMFSRSIFFSSRQCIHAWILKLKKNVYALKISGNVVNSFENTLKRFYKNQNLQTNNIKLWTIINRLTKRTSRNCKKICVVDLFSCFIGFQAIKLATFRIKMTLNSKIRNILAALIYGFYLNNRTCFYYSVYRNCINYCFFLRIVTADC